MITLASEDLVVFLFVAAFALLLFYSFVLSREGRQDQRLSYGQIAILWILRLCVAFIVLFAIAEPAREEKKVTERLPIVPLIVDESLSMAFPESRDNPLVPKVTDVDDEGNPLLDPNEKISRYWAAQRAVDILQSKLSESHRVRVYTFSDSLKLLKDVPHRDDPEETPALDKKEIFASHPEPTGAYSNIGDAISAAGAELSGDEVSGIVVLSDGRQTGGQELARVIREIKGSRKKIPVHTVTFGTEFPLRDLRIDEVIASPEASLGDVLTFHVKITNQIASQFSTQLKMEMRNADEENSKFRPAGKRQITLNRGQQMVSISTIPEDVGLREYRFTLPTEADEVNTENNTATVSVKIVKRTLRVLLIAGQPSREYLYMVPALLRDPVIELSCYLQAADVDYTQQGNRIIERLPGTVKEWSSYDVAVLFDVDPNGITTQQLAGLEAMVADGGGLMIVAGRSHGLARLVQVHAARIRGLLPVEVDKNLHLNHDKVYGESFKAYRTRQGRMHPIMMASTDESTNEQIWKTFTDLDFYWYHPVKGPKSKAITLLERKGSDDGFDSTLMAIHRYADGAVFYSSINSLWRWRYPYESYDYDRLWTRIIRYLGEARLLGTQQQVSLTTDRGSYSPGEDVEITLRVLDPALMSQLASEQIFVSVTGDDKDQYMVQLQPDSRGESFYRGTYRARRVGTMVANAKQAAPDADSEAKPLFDVKHGFQVKMQSLENVDTSADLEGMAKLALETNGKNYNYRTMGDLEKLVEVIPDKPQVIVERRTIPIWDGVVLLAAFLVLVVAELSLRKLWGLL